ncbi:MAG TPA: YcaO-like family protein [Myxococcales bacterium]|nr:YcaO-like family protein [Myxococcales bacterium]
MDALLRAIGVTRVARVTGLDRCGVEVACAIRPLGHVLQVCNGKGETWEEARATALSEAAELWAAERVRQADLVYGSLRELPGAWAPRERVAPRLWSPRTRIAWVRARELFSGAEVLVPAQVVHCLPRGGPPLGPLSMRWTSNGMGAHPLRERALRHALLELIERDQLARALSRGWTPRAIAARKLDASRLPLWRRLRAAGFEAHVFDLSGALAVAGAILVDLEDGPVPVTAGYACRLTPEEAVRGALLEAAQSRLTDVHGAREDVAPADRSSMRALRAACERARPRRTLRQMPRVRGLREALRGRRIAVAELAREPLHVVKAVAPDLRLSGLL